MRGLVVTQKPNDESMDDDFQEQERKLLLNSSYFERFLRLFGPYTPALYHDSYLE
jgi:hypothetical protein